MLNITRPAALVVALIASLVFALTTAYADGPQRRNNRRRPARRAQVIGFAEAHVSRAIQARIGTIRSCYERQLRGNPDLAGKVTVEFTVAQTGSRKSHRNKPTARPNST